MGLVYVEGKPITVPDSIIDAGIETIRMALAVDVPDVENAEITIETAQGAPIVSSRSASVVKRTTPKG